MKTEMQRGAAPEITIRDASDDDAAGLIALIGGCFAEYPGCLLDVDGEIPELRAIARYTVQRDGRFWVAEADGQIVGCIGIAPSPEQNGTELLKLYVDRGARGCGLGGLLAGLVEAEAAQRQAGFIELWTDTRFTNAHRLYERLGYQRQPETRDLHDISHSVEFHYIKRLGA